MDLMELSQSLSGVVEAVGPSVVRVEAGRGVPSSGVAWSDELVVTVHHGLEREEGLEVGLSDGSTVQAALVGRDPATDLAVLRTEGRPLHPARTEGAPGLKVGHLLLGIARPGRSARATLGIASAIGPEFRTHAGGKLEAYLEVELGRYPGFSGGAVVDASGALAGVSTTGLLRGRILAIPAVTVRRVVASLLSHGHVRRGFLGVGVYPVRLPPPLAQQAGQGAGAIVISLQPDGAAAKGGVMLGDVLLSFDGQPIHGPGELVGLLDEERVGKDAALRVVRGGELRDVSVRVAAR